MDAASDLPYRKWSARLLPVLLLLVWAAGFVAWNSFATRNVQIIKFTKLSGPIVNPLMGWAPWATIEKSNQPHTLVYASLTWRDFEPKEGFYDFATFEKTQQLARWRQEGKRVIFRFVADVPGNEPHLDIPDWLFEKIKGQGDFYDNEYGKGFSPDYSNLVVLEYHQKAIKALGERYGKDGFLAFIELGSLGHWGEWHTHSGIAPLPPEEIRDQYVHHYVDAFPGTFLLMRRPFSIAPKLGLGLYNDMTADPAQTSLWLDWIAHGGSLPSDEFDLVAMPDGWQLAPIGGEQSPTLSNEQVYGKGLDQTVELLKRSHTTFIGPNCPYSVENVQLQSGLDEVLSTIGYRIYLERVEMPRTVLLEKRMPITLTFSNDGIAPLYYNWQTRLYLFDSKGNTVRTYSLPMDLRKVLPGMLYDVAETMPLNNLPNGTYSVGIAIIDPMTDQPAVRFANENTRQDLIQYIGSFEIKRFPDLGFLEGS
jgi:hypothetical protein